jgi:ElaA protein
MEIFGADTVYIEAQVYAQPFYENLGFVRISDEFLEDGIPHVKMLWKRVESGE